MRTKVKRFLLVILSTVVVGSALPVPGQPVEIAEAAACHSSVPRYAGVTCTKTGNQDPDNDNQPDPDPNSESDRRNGVKNDPIFDIIRFTRSNGEECYGGPGSGYLYTQTANRTMPRCGDVPGSINFARGRNNVGTDMTVNPSTGQACWQIYRTTSDYKSVLVGTKCSAYSGGPSGQETPGSSPGIPGTTTPGQGSPTDTSTYGRVLYSDCSAVAGWATTLNGGVTQVQWRFRKAGTAVSYLQYEVVGGLKKTNFPASSSWEDVGDLYDLPNTQQSRDRWFEFTMDSVKPTRLDLTPESGDEVRVYAISGTTRELISTITLDCRGQYHGVSPTGSGTILPPPGTDITPPVPPSGPITTTGKLVCSDYPAGVQAPAPNPCDIGLLTTSGAGYTLTTTNGSPNLRSLFGKNVTISGNFTVATNPPYRVNGRSVVGNIAVTTAREVTTTTGGGGGDFGGGGGGFVEPVDCSLTPGACAPRLNVLFRNLERCGNYGLLIDGKPSRACEVWSFDHRDIPKFCANDTVTIYVGAESPRGGTVEVAGQTFNLQENRGRQFWHWGSLAAFGGAEYFEVTVGQNDTVTLRTRDKDNNAVTLTDKVETASSCAPIPPPPVSVTLQGYLNTGGRAYYCNEHAYVGGILLAYGNFANISQDKIQNGTKVSDTQINGNNNNAITIDGVSSGTLSVRAVDSADASCRVQSSGGTANPVPANYSLDFENPVRVCSGTTEVKVTGKGPVGTRVYHNSSKIAEVTADSNGEATGTVTIGVNSSTPIRLYRPDGTLAPEGDKTLNSNRNGCPA